MGHKTLKGAISLAVKDSFIYFFIYNVLILVFHNQALWDKLWFVNINQSIKFYLYSPYSQTTVRLIGL